jgi:DNA-binding MarR family transcriptional regulator
VSLPTGPTPCFLVWRLSMKWRTAVDRALAPLGLTHAQYSLLASLYGMRRAGDGAKPSQRRLADHTGLEALYVSKLARTLESTGLIARDTDPDDSRAVLLSLTPHGEEVVGRAVVVVRELHHELLRPLGGLAGEDTKQLVTMLNTLLDHQPGE